MAATDVVTLAEAKAQLNITDSSADTELPVFIEAATAAVEDYVGAVVARQVTEVRDGGRAVLLLKHVPVLSVTSVTEDGTVLDASAYQVDTDAGALTRVSGSAAVPFLPGVGNVQITYQAGRVATTADVPGRYKMAALIIVQHLWETQRPAAAGPFSQGADDYDPRYSYSIPRRALELLGEPVGGIA
jgi:uncharacterized phiE125 gp8 family phage protein